MFGLLFLCAIVSASIVRADDLSEETGAGVTFTGGIEETEEPGGSGGSGGTSSPAASGSQGKPSMLPQTGEGGSIGRQSAGIAILALVGLWMGRKKLEEGCKAKRM